MKTVQSNLHRTRTYDGCIILLSCFDDKRYMLGDEVNRLVSFRKAIRFLKFIEAS